MLHKAKKITSIPLLLMLVVGVFFSFALSLSAPLAHAETPKCGDGKDAVRTSFDFSCPGSTDPNSSKLENNPIYVVLLFVINNLLAPGVGVVIAGSIIWQAIQYSAANGSADKVKSAKNGIMNAIIALLLFLFMFSILNFLIPGGIFAQ